MCAGSDTTEMEHIWEDARGDSVPTCVLLPQGAPGLSCPHHCLFLPPPELYLSRTTMCASSVWLLPLRRALVRLPTTRGAVARRLSLPHVS
jgi:hypothetical protein